MVPTRKVWVARSCRTAGRRGRSGLAAARILATRPLTWGVAKDVPFQLAHPSNAMGPPEGGKAGLYGCLAYEL